jgi:2-iminoacetate synthase ThiH
MSDRAVRLSETEIKAMVEEAAETGAIKALAKVGLHDEAAVKDVGELRSLLDTWRLTKRTVITTVAKWITFAILSALALGAIMQMKGVK